MSALQYYRGKDCSQCSQYVLPTIAQMLAAIKEDSKLAGHYPAAQRTSARPVESQKQLSQTPAPPFREAGRVEPANNNKSQQTPSLCHPELDSGSRDMREYETSISNKSQQTASLTPHPFIEAGRVEPAINNKSQQIASIAPPPLAVPHTCGRVEPAINNKSQQPAPVPNPSRRVLSFHPV